MTLRYLAYLNKYHQNGNQSIKHHLSLLKIDLNTCICSPIKKSQDNKLKRRHFVTGQVIKLGSFALP